MPGEELGRRKRAPPGFYQQLSGGKLNSNSKMAEEGECESLKKLSKPKKPKSGSKKGSKASSKIGEGDSESLAMLEEEKHVEEELEELDRADAFSRHLHGLAAKGQIEFLEDIEPPEELEKDEVWKQANQDHEKENEVLNTRMVRLDRRSELMRIKEDLRRNRLEMLRREKEIEMTEKRNVMSHRQEWMKVVKEEMDVEREWRKQEEEVAALNKLKRVDGWVASAAQRVSKGEIDSIKSVKSLTKPKERTGESLSRGKKGVMGGIEGKVAADQLHRENSRDQPEKGISHLRRMGVLPAYGMDTEPSIKQLPDQKQGLFAGDASVRMGDPWDHLSVKGRTGKEADELCAEFALGDQREKHGKQEKNKVKSGKYAKSHAELMREESWPHLSVLRQYSRRTTFDHMEFDAFVAGETRIIGSMFRKDSNRAMGRLRVLCRVAHWQCKCKDWGSVRNIYESIIESVELGEVDWDDAFDSYESFLPPPASVLERMKREDNRRDEKKEDKGKDSSEKKVSDVFWCKDFQKGNCTETAPHWQKLKPDEKPVLVVHICATCWMKNISPLTDIFKKCLNISIAS